MAKFVKLKAFTHGLGVPARDFIVNVEHIVSASESTYNDDKGNSQKPCVYVTTPMVRELMVDCSIEAFMEDIDYGFCRADEEHDTFAASKLQAIPTGDAEIAHSMADQILCKLLKSIGYTKTVEAFEKIEKWYS